MIVGGFAVAFHGFARNTKDLDIFYRREQENINRLKAALIAFDFSRDEVGQLEFAEDEIISFGLPPLRIDLINKISGIAFEDAAPNAIQSSIDEQLITFIGREDLLRNKRSTGRMRDMVDVEDLT